MLPFTKPVKQRWAPTLTKLFWHWLSLLGIRKLLSKLISQCLLSWVITVQEHLLFSGNVWGQWGDLIVPLAEWNIPPQPGNFSWKKTLIFKIKYQLWKPKMAREHFYMWGHNSSFLISDSSLGQRLSRSPLCEGLSMDDCHCFGTPTLNASEVTWSEPCRS